jgi:hypothetical protein
MSSQNKKNIFFGKLAKLTLGSILFLAFAYLILGFSFDSSFFARDANEKTGRVLGATTLSLRIIGPPEKPVLSAEPLCSYGGSPFVRLSWLTTRDTDYYDLERDLNPLVSGVAALSYDDYAVSSGTSYSYLITAFGPAGQTASDPIVATTNICSALPDPTCEITSLNSLPLGGYSIPPTVTTPRPLFSGTTNIANALIAISLVGPTSISNSTTASLAGFWSWQPMVNLSAGSYALTITATDPNELTRQQSTILSFVISAPPVTEENKTDHEDKEKKKKKTEEISTTVPVTPTGTIIAPFEMKLEVQNQNSIVYSGRDLKTKLTIASSNEFKLRNQSIKYLIVDSKGTLIFQTEANVNLSSGVIVEKNISLPRLLKNGRYKVIAQTENAGIIISAESFFTLQEPPLVVAGPVRFTLTELLTNLGWVIAILILFLLVFLILLSIEYWLYKHSQIHITEDLLKKEGFLDKRKGVSQ